MKIIKKRENLSKETLTRMRMAKLGKKRSKETREKIRKTLTGKHLSVETKIKIGKARSKFSQKKEDLILDKYNFGGFTHKTLAKEYEVAKSTICGIIYRAKLRCVAT